MECTKIIDSSTRLHYFSQTLYARTNPKYALTLILNSVIDRYFVFLILMIGA